MLSGITELCKDRKSILSSFSLLALVLFAGTNIANAETGQNYDRNIIAYDQGIPIYQWKSHYERIFDGSKWVNYFWSEDTNKITFESKQIKYEFDKNFCTFQLFDPKNNKSEIESFNHELTINGIKEPLSPCSITSITTNEDGLNIIITRSSDKGELKTIYEINGVGRMEWTHEITNTDPLSFSSFGVEETCKNCSVLEKTNDLIIFGKYTLDTKNSIHHRLKSEGSDNLDYIFHYEGDAMFVNQKLIIDPVFGYSTGTFYSVRTLATTGTSCGTPDSVTSEGFAYDLPNTASSAICRITSAQFNTTTIPDLAIPESTLLRYDRISTDSQNLRACNYNPITNKPSTASASTLWTDIQDGTPYATDSSDGCLTLSGNDYVVNLGTNANTDLRTLLSQDWFAVGITATSLTRDGDIHGRVIDQPELEVTYSFIPLNFYPQSFSSLTVGDTAKLTGMIFVNGTQNTNITQTQVLVNGSAVYTNSTDQNSTKPYILDFGPIWYHMATSGTYNITLAVTAENSTHSQTNGSSIYITPEYIPEYEDAVDVTQGTVNHTYSGNVLSVNRVRNANVTDTWQIECNYKDFGDAITNSSGTWDNETNIGYYNNTLGNLDFYVSCYNDGELFLNVPLFTNSSNYILPGMQIFDQLGGFLGAPSILLFILAIFSWGTGRNFPTVLIIGVSALGLIASWGLLALTDEIWGLIVVIAAIGILGVRKFF